MQTCERWLIPVNEEWAAAPTGNRRHYVPAAFQCPPQRARKFNYLARCGTGVSLTRTDRLKEDGRWNQLIPCQRCVDSVQAHLMQYDETSRTYALILESLIR